MENTYMELAESIAELAETGSGHECGLATVKSLNPMKLEYEGIEISSGIFASKELVSAINTFNVSGEANEELADVLGEHLEDTQLSAGDIVFVMRINEGETTVVLSKLCEVC